MKSQNNKICNTKYSDFGHRRYAVYSIALRHSMYSVFDRLTSLGCFWFVIGLIHSQLVPTSDAEIHEFLWEWKASETAWE